MGLMMGEWFPTAAYGRTQPLQSSTCQVDEVHREICGFPSGSPICWGSGIDDEDATKFIYNNGNNSSTDNITAGVAA